MAKRGPKISKKPRRGTWHASGRKTEFAAFVTETASVTKKIGIIRRGVSVYAQTASRSGRPFGAAGTSSPQSQLSWLTHEPGDRTPGGQKLGDAGS